MHPDLFYFVKQQIQKKREREKLILLRSLFFNSEELEAAWPTDFLNLWGMFAGQLKPALTILPGPHFPLLSLPRILHGLATVILSPGL